ncbi:pilus assembly PilX N-terminal domain-containing protein [Patescibacteria group bacterium]|nr:pilus assembly PilX N-terminal domain-containing protein [Patescibacteria group bacterium]
MLKKFKTHMGEEGFAPLMVAIIIIIVLSLLTIGFITLVDQNQKNALNLQLNNDAYYAAESGINDAIAAIDHGFNQNKTYCGPDTSPRWKQYLGNNQINGPSDYYNCLLIDQTPNNLQYSAVTASQPTVALLSTPGGVNPTDIEFTWQPSSSIENSPYAFANPSWFPNCSSGANGACLPPASGWEENGKPITGILRVALTPLPNRGPLPTDTSTTYTAFLYPAPGNGIPSYAPSYSSSTIGVNSGAEVSGYCSNNPQSANQLACTVDIPVCNSPNNLCPNGYIMSMTSLYTNSQVEVYAFDNGTPLEFRNAQAVIDSTGSDHGVKKRIQVRFPTLNDTGLPAYDIASGHSICADLKTYPPNLSTGNPGGTSSSCGL